MAYKDKADQAAAQRRHYDKKKQYNKDKAREKQQLLAQMIRDAKNKPCMDCGLSYPYYVMDFDHRDDEIKLYNVAEMARRGSIQKLEEEIAKCDVVCSNCHRERTFRRLS
jgi:hypothetical protein